MKFSTAILLIFFVLVGAHIHYKTGLKNFAKQAASSAQAGIKKAAFPVNVGDAQHKDVLRRSMHRIVQTTALEGAGCTAVAVGPHALLTASHCELGTDTVKIDENKEIKDKGQIAHIVGHIRDDSDHSIYLLEDVVFSDIAALSSTPLQQGDDVFMWGNPEQFRDQFRRGYMSGTEIDSGRDDKKRTMLLFDLNITHGDSGSAIFNSLGLIASVASCTDGSAASGLFGGSFHLACAYPLAFTNDQINRARNF